MPQKDEAAFRRWYAERAQKYDLNPDPDDPRQFYDYRAAFRAGAEPDASKHWPSDFKRPGHPDEIVGGFNTRTLERVPGTPRMNEADLVKHGWDAEAAKQLAATPEEPMPQRPKIFKLSSGKPVSFPQEWSDDQVADVLQQMENDFDLNPVELPDKPPPPPGVRPADWKPAGPVAGRGTSAQALSTPEQARFAARVTPAVASGMAALMTEGVSVPMQMGVQALINGIGSGTQAGVEGADVPEVLKRAGYGAGWGAGGALVGAGSGAVGKYLKAKGTPIRITGGGMETSEEVPTGILDQYGKMTTRTQTTKTPEWTKLIPPDTSKIQNAGDAMADVIGMFKPKAAFAARGATRALASPATMRDTGALLQYGFKPGVPMSVNALLALLNRPTPKK